MQMKQRCCSRCINWDTSLPVFKDGIVSAPCEVQLNTSTLLVVPLFTRGSDTCSKFKRGRKAPPQLWGDIFG